MLLRRKLILQSALRQCIRAHTHTHISGPHKYSQTRPHAPKAPHTHTNVTVLCALVHPALWVCFDYDCKWIWIVPSDHPSVGPVIDIC